MKLYAGMDPRLSPAEMIAHARRVEALGYDGVHVPETVHDSLGSALLVVANTERVIVRTAVTLAFVRSPTLTAYAAWDLSKYSGGRFQLGLGTQIRQNIADRYGMPWGDPVGRMRDYLCALRALYGAFRSGGSVSHEGSYYRLTRLQPFFNPGPDPTTVPPRSYLGGVNPGICRLAGEMADGFITHPTNSDPEYLRAICLPNLEAGATAAGRDLPTSDFELVVGAQVITGATDAELAAERERQRRLFAFLYSTPAYSATLALRGWDGLVGELGKLVRAGRWDDLSTVVPDELLDAMAPTASFNNLPGVLRERYSQLCQGLLLSPPSDAAHDQQFTDVIAATRAD